MSTISAVFDQERSCAVLSITLTEPIARLERLDANGLHPVRQELDYPTSGSFVIDDYEAALTGPVRYLLTTSDLTEAEAEAEAEACPIIHCVTNPALRYVCERLTAFQGETSWATATMQLINGEWPRASFGPAQAGPFTLVALFEDYGAANALVAALDGRATYMLRQSEHAGLDAYFTPLTARIQGVTPDRGDTLWSVEITAQTLGWPTGRLQSNLGRNYAADLNTAPTYLASLRARPLYENRQKMS